ncbi:MAG: 16S rRNA (uracil(1498)-N(3))-methyltransferase [bacterium]|nr:16S rRNA (uracil(1498)-N(3))-methyltransferase [bacterium]
MAAHRCYCAPLRPGRQKLPEAEAHHAGTVRRARVGEVIELFDGCGVIADATVVQVGRGGLTVEVQAPKPGVPRVGPLLKLCCAVPKGPRQRILVEKCTELGVSVLQPIIAEHSVVRPDASVVSRWHRYAVEAGKQSGQAWITEMSPPVTFKASLAHNSAGVLRLLASTEPNASSLEDALRAAAVGTVSHIAVWIGPEGGFSEAEVAEGRAAGLIPITLGDSILRVETAAIAVAAAVRLRSG